MSGMVDERPIGISALMSQQRRLLVQVGVAAARAGVRAPGHGMLVNGMDENLQCSIRERAFALWEVNGRLEGREIEYWVDSSDRRNIALS
jgi:hypothetical protein